MNRLQQKYKETVVSHMMEKFGYKNVMEVPRIEKVVINIGVGDAIQNAKALEDSVRELEQITGQKAVVTRAKKSIANFAYLIVINFREDQLFLDTQGIIAASVKGSIADTAEITHTR